MQFGKKGNTWDKKVRKMKTKNFGKEKEEKIEIL